MEPLYFSSALKALLNPANSNVSDPFLVGITCDILYLPRPTEFGYESDDFENLRLVYKEIADSYEVDLLEKLAQYDLRYLFEHYLEPLNKPRRTELYVRLCVSEIKYAKLLESDIDYSLFNKHPELFDDASEEAVHLLVPRIKDIDVEKIAVMNWEANEEIEFNRWLVESLTPGQLQGLTLQIPLSWRWSYFIENGVATIRENVTPEEDGWEYYDDWLNSH